jgi:hypothetical protein
MPQKFTSRRGWLAAGLIIIILAGLVLWWRGRWADTPPGNPAFGLCFISPPDSLAADPRYDGAITAGARLDRWPLYWHWVDGSDYAGPHRDGQHDYDALVEQELRRGLTPVVILMGTPARFSTAAPPPIDPSATLPEHIAAAQMSTAAPIGLFEPIFADGSDAPAPGKAINPANPWAVFVANTVERYRPGGALARRGLWPAGAGVRHWEIWNEPDYATFWAGSVAEYYRLLQVAHQTINSRDPAATVLLGGLAFYDQPDWFNQLLRLTGGDPGRAWFDVFSFHHYLSLAQSERQLERVRASLNAYGRPDTPIWITESGVSVWDDEPALSHGVPPTAPLRGAMDEQAAYIIENSALAFYHGVARYFHFMLHDDCGDGPSSAYGLRRNFADSVCGPAAGQPRPAYAAYQLAAAQFRGLIPLWRQSTGQAEVLAFYRPADRTRVVVAWATTGLTATVTVPATGSSAQLHWVESSRAVTITTGFSLTHPLSPTGDGYRLTLPPATNQNSILPDDPSFQIGGRPFLLIEPDHQPPTATLLALPPTSPEHMLVRWQGDDPGSGIGGYRVWVSEEGQPLRPWLTATTAISANFTGPAGHSYGFAVNAIDRAGNESAPPVEPQFTTQVIPGLPVEGTVFAPTGRPVVSAAVTISGANTLEQLTPDAAGRWGPVALLPGDYQFAARPTGPDFAAWPAARPIDLTAPVSLTLTLAPPENTLAAGDFEGGEVWSVWDWAGQVNLTDAAFDGRRAARLGDGRGEPVSCPGSLMGQRWVLTQTVTVPLTRPTLSLLYTIDTPRPVDGNRFSASVAAGGQTTPVIGPIGQAADWAVGAADLAAWAGQTIGLRLEVTRCNETPFSVTLDRVSVDNRPVR